MKFRIITIFSVFLLSIGLFSCSDDPIYDSGDLGEGEASVTADITFTPLVPTLGGRAVQGGTHGEAIKDMENICVLMYNDKGFYKKYFFDSSKFTLSNTTDTPDGYPADGTHKAESFTKKARVRLDKIPFGYYRIYAVANVPESVLTDEFVQDINNVRNYSLTWNDNSVAANNQMFGYFSTDNSSKGFDAPRLAISRPGIVLQAWVKRAASKVTVAFDGSGLKDGVEIFIKSVKIKDIPASCLLGNDNPFTPSDDAQEHEIDLISDPNQIMTYYPDGVTEDALTDASYTSSWPGYVSKAHPINGYHTANDDFENLTNEAKLERLHSETNNALYFYENLQGKGVEGTPTDKHQQVSQSHKDQGIVSYPDGIDPANIAWKDAKKYGTYIEVQAYYKSNNEKEGQGRITYRFMLGKDTHLDYNAERSHHYKLTLKFKGWANDVDWHIDYRKDPTKLRFPVPFFISYLYGQRSMIPLEFDAPKDVKIEKIEAEIVKNDWYPTDCTYGWNGGTSQPGKNLYNSDYRRYVSSTSVQNKPWNGFLSLRKPKNLLLLPEPYLPKNDSINDIINEPSILNKGHYEDSSYPLGTRTYSAQELEISSEDYITGDDDKAHVSWDNGTYYVKLPIWTRARQMIARTGYTGSNPYNAYYRQASVKVKITLSDGTVLSSDKPADIGGLETVNGGILVNQVRRLVNPKGVYRSANITKDFHVVLKVLKSDADMSFTDLKSMGPWRAYVIADTEESNGGFITLESQVATTTVADYKFEYRNRIITRKSIEGIDDSNIDFYIKFKGTASKPRYAVIRVEYNYCSCYHLIFVRQGYDADDSLGTGQMWCSGNNITQSEVAQNPLNEGSLFRFGNWIGIKAESNVNGSSFTNRLIKPDYFYSNEGKNLKMTDGTTKNFSKDNIPFVNPDNNPDIKFQASGGLRVATLEDYYKIAPDPSRILSEPAYVENFPIKTGYGVCYGDEATETATSVLDAFGYNEGNTSNEGKGMRGCFAYNVDTGGNLFFPLGTSGFGHRKASITTAGGASRNLQGVLRYNCNNRWGYFNPVTPTDIYKFGVYEAPLFFDVFRSNGAIYWLEHITRAKGNDNQDQNFIGWDINYSTYDFGGISTANIISGGSADACFVRCIKN